MKRFVFVLLVIAMLLSSCFRHSSSGKKHQVEKLKTNKFLTTFIEVGRDVSREILKGETTYNNSSGRSFWIGDTDNCTSEKPCLLFRKSGNAGSLTIVEGIVMIKFSLGWNSENNSLLTVVMNNGSGTKVTYYDLHADGELDFFEYPEVPLKGITQSDNSEAIKIVYKKMLEVYFYNYFSNTSKK